MEEAHIRPAARAVRCSTTARLRTSPVGPPSALAFRRRRAQSPQKTRMTPSCRAGSLGPCWPLQCTKGRHTTTPERALFRPSALAEPGWRRVGRAGPPNHFARGDAVVLLVRIRRKAGDYSGAVREVAAQHWRYRTPITSCSCAVSTNCWKLVSLPSRTLNTWQTCASKVLPVALKVPV